MKEDKVIKAANHLYDARVGVFNINKLPSDCIPKTTSDAYLIQDHLIKIYLNKEQSIQVIGNKIGCTNKAAQEQINVTQPFYGRLLSKYIAKSECKLSFKNFISPFAEPEFSFKIKKTTNKNLKISDFSNGQHLDYKNIDAQNAYFGDSFKIN